MKIQKKGIKPEKKKAKSTARNGSMTEFKGKFLKAKPVDIRKLGVVAPKGFRSFASVVARDEGLKYVSVSVDDDNAVFILVA